MESKTEPLPDLTPEAAPPPARVGFVAGASVVGSGVVVETVVDSKAVVDTTREEVVVASGRVVVEAAVVVAGVDAIV